MQAENFEELLIKLTNFISLVEGREYKLKIILINGRLKYISFLDEETPFYVKNQEVVTNYRYEDIMEYKRILWGERIEDLEKTVKENYCRYPYLETLIGMLLNNRPLEVIYSYLNSLIHKKNENDDIEIDKLTNQINAYREIIDFVATTNLDSGEKLLVIYDLERTIENSMTTVDKLTKRKVRRSECYANR